MNHETTSMGMDGNGCPTEIQVIDGREYCIHHDDIPASDITTVHGVRCTTPLRTVIDIAPDVSRSELQHVVDDCLARGLFTVYEARVRLAQPDMTSRRGALLLRDVLAQ